VTDTDAGVSGGPVIACVGIQAVPGVPLFGRDDVDAIAGFLACYFSPENRKD
jgi:hypothetical protein